MNSFKTMSTAGRRIYLPLAAALLAAASAVSPASAEDNQAKDLLKAMSDYLAKQSVVSFDVDTSFEVITTDDQKLAIVSSGTVTMSRPDKIRVTRTGGFADAEVNFDGKTLTLLGKNANAYAQAEVPGTIDQLVDTIRDKMQRPLPAADLLMADVFNALMTDVSDAKDLGVGVIRGKPADHLAFRAKDVDWQIWIAQGDEPYPVRYTITSHQVKGWPEYTVDVSNWKTGSAVAATDFTFKAPDGAKKIDPKDLTDLNDMPSNFSTGAAQ